jgi:hypothetical protein
MSRKIYLLLGFLGAFSLLGCESQSNTRLKDENVIQLSKVLEQTPAYVGQTVVLDGNYFPACSSSNCTDDFILRSGVDQIKVYTMGNFKFKSMDHAQPVRVEGVFRASSQSPFIEATIIEKR